MVDFSVSVSQWVERAKGNMDAAFRGIAERAVARVKELTPVKTGYLRSNWSAVLRPDAIPQPGASIDLISAAKAGDVIYIVNPVSYARRIEYGFKGTDSLGRRYNQEGRGMVQQTVTELPQIARSVVAELRP